MAVRFHVTISGPFDNETEWSGTVTFLSENWRKNVTAGPGHTTGMRRVVIIVTPGSPTVAVPTFEKYVRKAR